MKRLLLTGASGLLGWNVCRLKRDRWEIHGVAHRHPIAIDGVRGHVVDLTDRAQTADMFRRLKPRAVIHAAAATNVNWCQENRAESYRINVEAPFHIAALCAESAIPYLFISSDMVFDGLSPPYGERDPVSPVNVYGEQKARAEEMVAAEYPNAVICRLPLMFGEPGPFSSGFVQPMIEAMRSGRELPLFTDEIRTPVSAESAVEGISLALRQTGGILHLGGRERVSRYAFGLLLARLAGFGEAGLRACRQRDVKMPAPRPRDVSLDSTRAFSLGYSPGRIEDELRRLLASSPLR